MRALRVYEARKICIPGLRVLNSLRYQIPPQVQKHLGLPDLMGVNYENMSEFQNSGCKKSKFRIIFFFSDFFREVESYSGLKAEFNDCG